MSARFYLMKYPKWFRFYLMGLAVLLCWLLMQPCLYIAAGRSLLAVIPAPSGMPFSIHFIHSVQKTPVEENLTVNDRQDGFVLQSTKYQSFGVGLPFLASDGNFHEEGNYFVMDHMNRKFSQLSLRPGVGTQLTSLAAGTSYRLYEQLPLGTKVDLYMAPYYKQWVGKVDKHGK